MTAYVISEVEVLDERLAEQYEESARYSIEQYDGRYVVRGASPDVVEGSWPETRRVVVEFPNMRRAREWYDSPEYARALEIRQSALDRRLLFVEGTD